MSPIRRTNGRMLILTHVRAQPALLPYPTFETPFPVRHDPHVVAFVWPALMGRLIPAGTGLPAYKRLAVIVETEEQLREEHERPAAPQVPSAAVGEF